MNVLGLNWQTPFFSIHETGASIVKDGRIIAAVNEDRLSGIKHDGSMPLKSLYEVLRIGKSKGISPEQIDFVAIPKIGNFSDYFFGLKELLYLNPSSVQNIFRIFPLLRDEKRLLQYLSFFGVNAQIRYVEHHQSHAASAFYSSGFREATVITSDAIADGIGVQKTSTVSQAVEKSFYLISSSFGFENSLGYFYSKLTNSLGFHPDDGEGKTSGLACYGNPERTYPILKNMIGIDGVKIKGNYGAAEPEKISNFSRKEAFRQYKNANYEDLEKFSSLVKRFGARNVAAGGQKVLEECCEKIVLNALKKNSSRNVCLAGGTFLNVKVNKRIRELKEVENLFVFPNPGDAGIDAGAALQVYWNECGKEFRTWKILHTYLGTKYSQEEIEEAIEDNSLVFERLSNPSKAAADLVAEGKVVGWFQGALEYGPRALGNRSVLADPRNPKMREKINNFLKKRDWFMPFAPSILSHAKEEYLENSCESPFMILAFDVPKQRAKEIPAVVHVDNTTRPHTVERNLNPLFFDLIKKFEKNSGIPMLLNTSFNRHNHVIARSPQDALNHLLWGCVEELVIGRCRVYKKFSKQNPVNQMKI